MRVLVTGSRDWQGPWAEGRVHDILRSLEKVWVNINDPQEPFVIVHGGCFTGADAIADRWARRRWYEPEVHEADWAQYGRAAGPIRNEEMANAGAGVCVAFLRDPDNDPKVSRGTKNMIELAWQAGIWTIVIPWHPEGQEPEDVLPQAA